MSLITFEIEPLCGKKQLSLMTCTWPCASFLIEHFCICVPDKTFCVWDLFWIGQFGATKSHVFSCFLRFSDKQFGKHFYSKEKSYHLEWQRTLLVSVIMRICLQHGFWIFHLWYCTSFWIHSLSLGASNFVSGKGNLNFFWTGSQENYFGLVVLQNNPKFQGRHILK